jgi:pimeloyl-ACP methyl ester carboxylesterase
MLLQTPNQLYSLLAAAGEASPYILVGHSAGGQLIQQYAALHPAQVVGLALIDRWVGGLHALFLPAAHHRSAARMQGTSTHAPCSKKLPSQLPRSYSETAIDLEYGLRTVTKDASGTVTNITVTPTSLNAAARPLVDALRALTPLAWARFITGGGTGRVDTNRDIACGAPGSWDAGWLPGWGWRQSSPRVLRQSRPGCPCRRQQAGRARVPIW